MSQNRKPPNIETAFSKRTITFLKLSRGNFPCAPQRVTHPCLLGCSAPSLQASRDFVSSTSFCCVVKDIHSIYEKSSAQKSHSLRAISAQIVVQTTLRRSRRTRRVHKLTTTNNEDNPQRRCIGRRCTVPFLRARCRRGGPWRPRAEAQGCRSPVLPHDG